MPCDTQTLRGQTLTQRKDEVRRALAKLETLLASRKVRPVIGRQGAIAFDGWLDEERGRVSDTCAYRLIMSQGGSLAKATIARAEAMAGRGVNKQAVAVGVHSHDGGRTWHEHKG